MDFAEELKKLIDAEDPPPADPLSELTRVQLRILESLRKQDAGISDQIEEVYDIIKGIDENTREVKNAAKRETRLLGALIAMNDLYDTMLSLLNTDDASHIEAIAAKREEALDMSGLERCGRQGQRLDPHIHTVASAEYGDAPLESVTRVLEYGYIYRDNVIRKATVIISKGSESK